MFKFLLPLLLAFFVSAASAAVDVNTAGAADLDSIKGIGPGTSSKVLEARKSGKFKDWPDLIQRVPGIGEKRAVKLSAQGLTVNGDSFKAASASTDTGTEKPTKLTKPAQQK